MSPDPSQPFLPYGHQSIDADDVEAVARAVGHDTITQGPRIEAFEETLCRVTGARHAVAVSHGTSALHLAYVAAGLQAGDEIVTTANTFLATANAAVFCGARPVFVDIEPRHRNLDPERVEAGIGARTRAIVAVDFAGHPAEMDALREIAARREVRLIADACHSLGGRYRGRAVGSLADLSCLSFHPVKSVTTGEGGAVLTDDPELADRCRRARTHGMVRDPARLQGDEGPWYYEMQDLGWNYRITDFQCALGLRQLGKLDGFVRRRAELARRYDRLLAEVDGVRMPEEAPHVQSAWHLYVVEVPPAQRRFVFERLREAGIGVQVHYIPVYRHPFYRRLLGETSPLACTEAYYSGAISLPLYPDLEEAEQDRVVARLTEALSAATSTAAGRRG